MACARPVIAVGFGGPFFVQYLLSGPGVFALFSHHAQRELQLESTLVLFREGGQGHRLGAVPLGGLVGEEFQAGLFGEDFAGALVAFDLRGLAHEAMHHDNVALPVQPPRQVVYRDPAGFFVV